MAKTSQRRDRKARIVALIVMAIAVIVYIGMEITATGNDFFSRTSSTRTTLIETSMSFNYDTDSNSVFHTFRNGIFHVSKDGVKYRTSDNRNTYDFAYNMSAAPIVVSNEGVIAVAEPKGRNLYVFNTERMLYVKQMDNVILTFSVNKNGYTSVITQDGSDYRLDVFTDKGESITGGGLYNIYPVATTISEDNRILAISLVNANDVQINSNVIFSFINSGESINYADGIFANATLEKQFAGIIRFGEDNNIVMISERAITVGRIDSQNKYVSSWTKDVENEMGLVRFNGNSGFAVTYGDAFINKTGVPPGTVELYSYSGETLFSYETGYRITHLAVSSNAVIVGANRKFTAYNRRGELWTYNAIQDAKQLLFLENTNTALLVTNNRAVVMKLGREQEQ